MERLLSLQHARRTELAVRRSAKRAALGPALLLCAALLLDARVAAQPTERSELCATGVDGRPSNGLALSGGGAHGGAHIGVLKALEELRVPIDCIAGTGIGAVIGGFYASGLSAAEIDEIARNIDWDTALWNTVPRGYRSFRRKNEDHLFLVNMRPGIQEGRLSFPIGLVQGQIVDMVLARATVGAYSVSDFDDLQMPFRAVATDITTATPVVLRQGDLALALRASMSLPAVLTPVDIDGRMLVDGGIAMNLPVEVAQSMGADVVIAVDVTSALLGRESMRSVLDITSQLTTLLTWPGTQQQKELLDDNDILLTPAFDKAQAFLSFALFADTIDRGYTAVMDQREVFAPLALDPASYAAYAASRPDPRTDEPPVIDFVRLDNRSRIGDGIITARLRDIPIGEPLDLDVVEAATNEAYGLGFFQNVRYEVVTDDSGATGLEIEINERSWGPNYAQFGMYYSSSSNAEALFGLAASYLRTGINEQGGEWRSTVVIGDEPALLVDRYQPLGREGLFFVEPKLNVTSTRLSVFDGDRIATEFDIREARLELAAGRELRGAAEVRAGLRGASGRYRLQAGEPDAMPGGGFRRGEFFARVTVDTLDSVAFPRSGFLSSVELRSSSERLSADSDFDQTALQAAFAKSWGRHTWLSTLRYDATVSGNAPLHSQFRLGGFLDMSGLRHNELSGQNAARIGTSYYRRIGDVGLLPAFAGISFELGNVWEDREAISRRSAIAAVSLWAGVGTPLGPVYVGLGRTDDGRDALYLALGPVF
jgi:NTE family protein